MSLVNVINSFYFPLASFTSHQESQSISSSQKLSPLITLSVSAPAALSVCKFSLHYPHKIGCFVMRIKQIIIHSSLARVKNKAVYKETIEAV